MKTTLKNYIFRMLRSGGLICVSASALSLPALGDEPSLSFDKQIECTAQSSAACIMLDVYSKRASSVTSSMARQYCKTEEILIANLLFRLEDATDEEKSERRQQFEANLDEVLDRYKDQSFQSVDAAVQTITKESEACLLELGKLATEKQQ